jgi:hypothetical protein
MVKVLFTNCLNICTKMVRKWTTAFMKLSDDDKTHVVDAIGDGKKKKEGSGLTPQTRSIMHGITAAVQINCGHTTSLIAAEKLSL